MHSVLKVYFALIVHFALNGDFALYKQFALNIRIKIKKNCTLNGTVH